MKTARAVPGGLTYSKLAGEAMLALARVAETVKPRQNSSSYPHVARLRAGAIAPSGRPDSAAPRPRRRIDQAMRLSRRIMPRRAVASVRYVRRWSGSPSARGFQWRGFAWSSYVSSLLRLLLLVFPPAPFSLSIRERVRLPRAANLAGQLL